MMDFVAVRYTPKTELKLGAVTYITPEHPDYAKFVDTTNVVPCHAIEVNAEGARDWIVIHHYFPEKKKLGRIYLRETECDMFYSYGDVPEDMIQQLEQEQEQEQENNAVREKIDLPGLLK